MMLISVLSGCVTNQSRENFCFIYQNVVFKSPQAHVAIATYEGEAFVSHAVNQEYYKAHCL